MKVLGIETSCDETAAAVVEDGTSVLSNVIRSQVEIHAPFGGIVPEIASRNHLQAIEPVVEEALSKAGCVLDQVDGVAVTIGPGLIGSLLVGVQFAKTLSLGAGVPLVGIDHVQAHIMAAFLDDEQRPPCFPFLALAVSGGHSSIALVRGFGEIEVLGRTLDDAAGEAFDKAATMLGLPYPGGVSMEKAAEGRNPDHVRFPRAMMRDSNLNMSFSGLKTALRRHLETRESRPPGDEEVGDLAASFQEAIVDALVRKTFTATARHGVNDIVVAGGVAANRRLRECMRESAETAGLCLHPVPLSLCTDNAAMIANMGHHYLFGTLSDAEAPRGLDMNPFMRHVKDGW